MADFITSGSFEDRLRYAITAAWGIFARKVGGKLIPVNKEASMQLQYAYILRQLLPLTILDALIIELAGTREAVPTAPLFPGRFRGDTLSTSSVRHHEHPFATARRTATG